MKPKYAIDQLYNSEQLDIPEKILWLAVIERGMIDYLTKDNGKAKYIKSEMRHWLFSDKPVQYNLVYICNMLFDDPATMVKKIRANVLHMQSNGIKRRIPFTVRRLDKKTFNECFCP